jgi:hypothetical protein
MSLEIDEAEVFGVCGLIVMLLAIVVNVLGIGS